MINSRFWKFDLKGQYSVQRGYRFGICMHDPPEHQSNHNLTQKWWRTICSLSIPPKTCVFWWTVFHNIIPTAVNLAQLHVPVSRWCPFCHNAKDSTCHALFCCQAMRNFCKNNDAWRWLKKFKIHDTWFFCPAWLTWSERCWTMHNSTCP